jgi:hypothetical protein
MMYELNLVVVLKEERGVGRMLQAVHSLAEQVSKEVRERPAMKWRFFEECIEATLCGVHLI